MKPRRLLRRPHKRSALALVLGGCIVLAGSEYASAADRWWDRTDSTNLWATANNWSTNSTGTSNPGSIPGASDVVIFHATNITTAQTIETRGNRSVQGLEFTTTHAASIRSNLTADQNSVLTIGSSGIDKTGTGAVTLAHTAATTVRRLDIELSANQTWQNNNATGTLTIGFLTTTANSSGFIKPTLGGGNRILTLDGTNTTASTGMRINSSLQDASVTDVLSVVKQGAGTWTLSSGQDSNRGTSTFTGGLTVEDGLLIALANSTTTGPENLLGKGVVTLEGGTISFRASGAVDTTVQDIDFQNNIAVAGNATIDIRRPGATSENKNIWLDKLTFNTGTLTVTGENNYKLDFRGATTLTGNATFNPTTAHLTLTGVIGETDGARGITKTGVGAMTLAGANTYSGNTLVSAGVLLLNNLSALQNSPLDTSGAGTVTANAGSGNYVIGGLTGSKDLSNVITTNLADVTTLTLNPQSGKELTYSGVIAGTRALTKTGAGTQILSGANTYTGATTITEGTLQLGAGGTTGSLSTSSAISISSGATLAINRSNTVTQGTDFRGAAITGAGGFTQSGTGTTILNQANTYTGATTVNAGRLIVGSGGSGSITSAVTVNSGGTLGGSGTITGNVVINSGGFHAPGNSPGTQTVTGDLTYESGSIFAWDLNANKSNNSGGGVAGTDYDKVVVSGTLTIDPAAIFRVVIDEGVDFGNAFWASQQSWSNIFDSGSLSGGWAENTPVSVYTFDSATNTYTYVPVEGSFTITGTTLNWTPIPEPGSLLAGALIGAGLLRRRRPPTRILPWVVSQPFQG